MPQYIGHCKITQIACLLMAIAGIKELVNYRLAGPVTKAVAWLRTSVSRIGLIFYKVLVMAEVTIVRVITHLAFFTNNKNKILQRIAPIT